MHLVKGEGTVYPKAGKSFDPAPIPKAIHDAGFTATEVEVVVDGTLVAKNDALKLDVPGLKHPFILAGGAKEAALKEDKSLLGKRIRVVGRVRVARGTLPPSLTIEEFESFP